YVPWKARRRAGIFAEVVRSYWFIIGIARAPLFVGIIIHASAFLFIPLDQPMKTRAGIVGHSGYSGQELVRILARHPHVEPVLLDHRDDHAAPAIRNASGPARIPCTAEAVRNEKLAVVFLGTAADVSMDLAPAMLAAGARVIDLSGAF